MKHISANLFTPRIISIILFLLIYSPNTFSQSLTAEQIYKKVSNAVVVVHAYDENNRLASQGSGVVLNDKGYVVTNYHVLSGNDRLEILHGKQVVPYVDIIGIDVEKDILILKIDTKKFTVIKNGDSKSLSIGQRVYAIGSPLGLENSISEGIISGLRSIDESQRNYIQMTASISPGSSGGAVVNEKGELIGISTLTATGGQNLNFAIPLFEILSVKIGSYYQTKLFQNFELFRKAQNAFDNGMYNESIKFYTDYINLFPNHESAYNNRGISRSKLNDYNGAIKDYSIALNIDSTLSATYNNRGYAKYCLGDFWEAINDYNSAILSENKISNFYINRGLAKNRIQDYHGAILDFNIAIEIDPNNINAYNSRGITKSNLDDYLGGIKDFEKAISLDHNNAISYFNCGVNKALINDHVGAVFNFNKVIELDPKNSEAYLNRGYAKYNLRDRFGACSDWSKAGELGLISAYDLIRKYCNN